jgi:arsenate reductase-like glutaredoxin family protein
MLQTSKIKPITLYFDSRNSKDRKILFNKELKEIEVKERDCSMHPPSSSELIEIHKKSNMPVSSLLNWEHPFFRKNFNPRDLHDRDYLKILTTYPSLLKTPFIVDKQTNLFSPIDNAKQIVAYKKSKRTSL